MKKNIIKIAKLCLLWFVLHVLFILIDGFSEKNLTADVAVIMGSQVYPNGIPCPRLQGRLEQGIKLYKNQKIKNIIVSGGTGIEKENEAEVMKQYLIKREIPESDIIIDSRGKNSYLTAKNSSLLMQYNGWKSIIVVNEAEVMKQYLIKREIPESDIIIDSRGKNSYLTAKNSSLLMQYNGWKSIIVVSDYFHLSRTKLAFKKFGIKEVYSSYSRYFYLSRDIFWSIPREFLGYYWYLVREYPYKIPCNWSVPFVDESIKDPQLHELINSLKVAVEKKDKEFIKKNLTDSVYRTPWYISLGSDALKNNCYYDFTNAIQAQHSDVYFVIGDKIPIKDYPPNGNILTNLSNELVIIIQPDVLYDLDVSDFDYVVTQKGIKGWIENKYIVRLNDLQMLFYAQIYAPKKTTNGR